MNVALITVGATGHVLPTLPVVAELVRRGVRVTYFTSANFEKTISLTGARFSPVTTVLTNQGQTKDDIQKDIMAELPLRFLSEAEQAIDQILPILERDRPDVIVCDALALAGRLAASALGLPRIQIFTSYAANEHFSVSRYFPAVSDEHPARQAAHRLADAFTQKYGVPHMDIHEIFEGAGDLNLVLLQRAFHPAGDTFDGRFVFVGAQVGERENTGTWNAPEDRKPVVYSSLGTLFNDWPEFYTMLAEAVRDLPVHMVSAIGTTIQKESLGKLPSNMTVAPFLPQLDILERASVFITHAGVGSVMEAIYFGVPMLGIPQMDEQITTAMRMQELGLGKAIPDKALVTPALLRASLLELLENRQYAQTMAVFKNDMHAAGGYQKAAQTIIDFVAAGSVIADMHADTADGSELSAQI